MRPQSPTLVIAGVDDFIFRPERQRELAASTAGAQLLLIERAGHNPEPEQPDQVIQAVRAFLPGPVG